ncbi:PREDICTED: uncharacterized protein LOC108379704 [Rhagoletis zephyria]|uniref:uncharacterized protein LOC108379704 n=1 Tax=Rhagoletis zephyria TaxID=28612 RepID=UPI00081162D6|nr:PREDICTED: uncharacterized protein LOC108379704 [Rhagoletis zephyria]
MEDIRQAARNDSIDVGASLSTPQKEENLHEYIYPVEFYQWLTMLPVEAPLETYYFYTKIFGPAVIVSLFAIVWCLCVIDAIHVNLACGGNLDGKRRLLLLLINPWHFDLLRGIVCQSSAVRFNYGTRRIIFILIFALGGTLNSFFSTKLVNWLTVPPRETPIEEFSEVGERNLQIQVSQPDIAEIKFYKGVEFWRKHSQIFEIVPTFDEYQKNIRKLDNRYGYIMSSLMWPTIEERQKYFQYPLFRLSEKLYYTKGALLSLPISENSMYKDLLSDFCLRARENGLLVHWYKETFFTMVRLGRFSLKDPSSRHRHQVLTLKEFEWVWIAYGVGICLSSVALLLERPWQLN